MDIKLLWEIINIFFTSEIWNNAILPLVITILTSGVLGLFVSKTIEKQRYQHTRDLERETFIREVTSQEKEKLLKGWTEIVINQESIEKANPRQLVRKFNELYLRTSMYGGEKLLNIVTLFQKHNFAIGDIPEQYKTKRQTFKTFVYLAVIASEIKYEFTQVKVSPLTLIELKITDFDEYEQLLTELYEEIKEEIKAYK